MVIAREIGIVSTAKLYKTQAELSKITMAVTIFQWRLSLRTALGWGKKAKYSKHSRAVKAWTNQMVAKGEICWLAFPMVKFCSPYNIAAPRDKITPRSNMRLW